jgi:hypothetical protein
MVADMSTTRSSGLCTSVALHCMRVRVHVDCVCGRTQQQIGMQLWPLHERDPALHTNSCASVCVCGGCVCGVCVYVCVCLWCMFVTMPHLSRANKKSVLR